MRDVAVLGVGMTRFGKFLDSSLKQLAGEAIDVACKDAGVTAEDLDAAYASNAIAGLITGQEMVRGQVVLRSLGIDGLPVVNVENACAGGATALTLAWQAVSSGAVDVALAYGVEKMTHEDRRRPIEAIATAMDVDVEIDRSSKSPFMEHYAERIHGYMEQTGATVEDFARVAVKAQHNGARNPRAQYGNSDATTEDILASSLVADPLTVMMCSPIGDGAAAVVLVGEDVVDRFTDPHPVWIRASVLRSGSPPQSGPGGIERAAAAAYEMAGIGPDELDVVELHDANAASEIMRYESLGLAPVGDGPRLVRDGTTRFEGQLPVNPSGGLIARGHPIGATGCAQIHELTHQLRGTAGPRQVEGARVALAENGGGWVADDVAADAVHILTADRG